MRVLVLGGSGFLGTHLLRYLTQISEIRVTAADIRPLKSQAFTSKVRFLQGDLCDSNFALRCLLNQDVIFQCAAQSSHLYSMQYPYQDLEINGRLSLQILETLRHHNPQASLIYPSSTTVTGKLLEDFGDEHHAERPLDLYSAHKSLAEKYHVIYHHRYGLKTWVLRFANLYGPFGHQEPEYNFMNHFIHCALEQKPIRVFGEGHQKRNVLFVEEAAEILWQASQRQELIGDIFMATSPFHYSVREIAESIADIFGTTTEHISWPARRERIEIGDATFSSEKIRALTGWVAKIDLRDGLKKTKEILEAFESEPIL